MSEGDERLETLVKRAAGIVAASENTEGVSSVMKLVGFVPAEISTMKWYMRVMRMAKLVVVEGKNNTPSSALPTNGSSVAAPATTTTSESTNSEATTPTDTPVRLLFDTPSTISTPGRKSPDKVPFKKGRRTSKQVHQEHAEKNLKKSRDKRATKEATRLAEKQKDLPKEDRKLVYQITKECNANFGATISHETVGRNVRTGHIGQSPLKMGPDGDFSDRIYKALSGAYVTFLKLEQAKPREQSKRKEISRRLNVCVNHAGHSRVSDKLARKLQRDNAHLIDVGKQNNQEARRAMWTTKYNMDVWFSTWKSELLDLGFTREKTAADTDVEGELVITEEQKRRIVNVDETDGSLDETTTQQGGRPAFVFYAPDVAGGATAVNKSGYSSTIICGSNAAGEPVPPHFQLKTLAKTDEGQKIPSGWFQHTMCTIGQFSHDEPKELDCTFGMNEKAGMNAVELEKYINNSILPLFPDIADEPGKRVILKLDSGPGRMNVGMLASSRVQGLLILPGIPNTTGTLQETDKLYGPFKTSCRTNIRHLAQIRFQKGLELKVTDIPLLVFGGSCHLTSVILENSFEKAFNKEANLDVWKKCGAVPLMRCPMHLEHVRAQVPVGEATAQNPKELEDPQVVKLKSLEQMNHFYANFLTSHGYQGSQLRIEAPKRRTYVGVTVPNTRERVQALQGCNTAGKLFHATGGTHVNTDSFFRGVALKERWGKIKAMEDSKKKRPKLIELQPRDVNVIKKKGEPSMEKEKKFSGDELKDLLEWKIGRRSCEEDGATNKKALIAAYMGSPKPKIYSSWKPSEEAALQRFKDELVPMKDTQLGVATAQMARAVTNNIAQLDEETKAALRAALAPKQGEEAPFVL